MVVNMNGAASLPTMVPGMDPAKGTSWAEMHLAQGNKFPEEKSDAASNLLDDNLETKEEDVFQFIELKFIIGCLA